MGIRKICFIEHDMTGDVDSRRMKCSTNVAYKKQYSQEKDKVQNDSLACVCYRV